jgi:iron complex transport system substrate-binding protein
VKRIVSFLASGTEIAVALGLQDAVVGISHECDWPPGVLDRPRVSRPRFDPTGLSSGAIDRALRVVMAEYGTAYEIDEALLLELKPDLVLTQAVCDVCAVPTPGVRQAVQRAGLDAEVVSLDAHTVDDILDSIEQVAGAADVRERAADVIAQLRVRTDTVRVAVADADRPRVLAIEWLDPPFAPGHWVPEMIAIAGGESLIGTAGSHSEQTTWEALAGLDPDMLIVMPCGYDLDATRRDANAASDLLHDVAPRAIDEGRAYIVDGSSYFNRSGPRFVTGIEILATLLHRDRFQTSLDGVAQRWPTGPRPIEPYQAAHC